MLLPVEDSGVRPAGPKDKCFYCGEVVQFNNEHHTKDCVIRHRTVVLEMTVKYVTSVPADWDVHMIEFSKNESSSCSANEIHLVSEQEAAVPDDICKCCQRTEFKFIREATEEDMEDMAYNDLVRKNAKENKGKVM